MILLWQLISFVWLPQHRPSDQRGFCSSRRWRIVEANALSLAAHLTQEQHRAVAFLAEFAKRMVVFGLAERRTPAEVSSVVRQIYRVVDELMDGCLSRGPKLSCTAGCFWCCFLRVKVTPLEVLCIADYVRGRCGRGAISSLKQHLAATDAVTRGMGAYQRACAEEACPLLVDAKCLVYPVRPISCRIYHSLDGSDCEAPLDDDGRCIKARDDICGLGVGVSEGLTEGLQAAGLHPGLLELTAGLRMALDEPALAEQWLVGKPAFAEAEIAN